MAWHNGATGNILASQLEGPQFKLELRFLPVRSFASSPHVHVSFHTAVHYKPCQDKAVIKDESKRKNYFIIKQAFL